MASKRCQSCKKRKAVWRVTGGFAAKVGMLVCDDMVCWHYEGLGGYSGSLTRIQPAK